MRCDYKQKQWRWQKIKLIEQGAFYPMAQAVQTATPLKTSCLASVFISAWQQDPHSSQLKEGDVLS